MVVDSTTGIVQKCFVNADGFRVCNFIVRNGLARWTKSGKWWKFRALPYGVFRKKKDEGIVVVEKETATTSIKKQ